jgi:hypothetical protein
VKFLKKNIGSSTRCGLRRRDERLGSGKRGIRCRTPEESPASPATSMDSPLDLISRFVDAIILAACATRSFFSSLDRASLCLPLQFGYLTETTANGAVPGEKW